MHATRSTLTRLALFVSLSALFVTGCAQKSVRTSPVAASPPGSAAREGVSGTGGSGGTQPSNAPADDAGLLPVYFGYDSNSLDATAKATLDQNARAMRALADVSVTIEGHCDERGTTEYNLTLGDRRAQVTRDYLVASGIDGSRIRTISLGKEQPFDEGHDEASWSANRRAQFVRR